MAHFAVAGEMKIPKRTDADNVILFLFNSVTLELHAQLQHQNRALLFFHNSDYSADC